MPGPSLRDVQRWMRWRIHPQPQSRTPELEVLNPQRGTPGAERLAVYADGYVARIEQALAEVYAALRHVLGDRTFHQLAHDYASAHASRESSLTYAGRQLPDFLSAWPKTAELPFLPDLARLEWAVCRAFHANEQRPLELGALAALRPEAWERTRLTFQPSVSVVSSAWPVLDLWTARATPRDQIAVDLEGRPQHVAVFRQGLQTHCLLLEPAEAGLLQELIDGRTLGEACGRLMQAGGEPPVGEWCSGWAAAGWIVKCETAGGPG